ncbi:MAG: heparinase II/III family protein [Kiritimatiellia bacterium]
MTHSFSRRDFFGLGLLSMAGAAWGLHAENGSSDLADFLARQIRARVAKPAPHPRLFATAADFARLKAELPRSELGRLGRDRCLFAADQMRRFPLPMRTLEGRRLLAVSQRSLARICTLAMAYRLRGDPRDAARALAEAEAVCAFKDWNPAHFLDTAEMTLAVAIAYDWLYDCATKQQRETLKKGLLRLGLCERNGALKGGGWVTASNNWGQVCHASLLAGAIAVMEDEPAVAEQTILRALANLPRAMAAFAPDGGFPEGPGFYWGYAMTFTVLAIDLLERTCGDDFGLARQPGFAASVDYLDLMTGPSGLKFNYADAGILPNQRLLARRTTEACSWWLANRFKRPDSLVQFEVAAFRAYCLNRQNLNPTPRRVPDRLFPLTLLWLNPPPAAVSRTTAPLCAVVGGSVPVAVQRTDWTPDAWYVGLKGGSARAPHGHMDGGSFVLDAKGCRWAEDLGSEDYHRMEAAKRDVWNQKQNAERWKIFRLGLASHNTLRIDRGDQFVLGTATFKSITTGPLSKVVVDLTPLYAGTERVERTGTLVPGGGYIMDDAVVGVKPGALVTWQMITYARVKEQDANRIVLVQKGPDGDDVTLTLTVSNRRTHWDVRDVGASQGPDESSNPGLTQISFSVRASGAGEAAFAVRFE